MALTVMTYNIKDGGRPGRLTAITRVIGQARPDILALQELRGFGRNGARLLHRLAGATGMRAVLARSVFGQPVAVLLREDAPILAKRQVYRPFHHAAARVTAGTDHGPLTVISTHLYPHWGRRRLWEARWLAHYADPRGLVLLMGDLNSLDPWSDHSGRLRDLPALYRRRHLRRDGRVDTRAVSTLSDAGFVDLCRQVNADDQCTVPTGHGGREFAPMRLDYILGTAPSSARHPWRAWSDHAGWSPAVKLSSPPTTTRSSRNSTWPSAPG